MEPRGDRSGGETAQILSDGDSRSGNTIAGVLMLSYLRCHNPLKQSKAEIQRRKIVLRPIFLKKPLFKIHHFCKRLQAAKYKNSNFVGHFRKNM